MEEQPLKKVIFEIPELEVVYDEIKGEHEIEIDQKCKEEAPLEQEVEKQSRGSKSKFVVALVILVLLAAVITYNFLSQKDSFNYGVYGSGFHQYVYTNMNGRDLGIVMYMDGSLQLVEDYEIYAIDSSLYEDITLIANFKNNFYYVIFDGVYQKAFAYDAKEYVMSLDGSTIYYVESGEEDTLYSYQVRNNKTVKIASAKGISHLCASTDGSSVTAIVLKDSYLQSTYLWKQGKEIDFGETLEVLAISAKGKSVYYKELNQNMLYRYSEEETIEIENYRQEYTSLYFNEDQSELIFYEPSVGTIYVKEGMDPIVLDRDEIEGVIVKLMTPRKWVEGRAIYAIDSFLNKYLYTEHEIYHMNSLGKLSLFKENRGGNYIISNSEDYILSYWVHGSMKILKIDQEKTESEIEIEGRTIYVSENDEIYYLNDSEELYVMNMKGDNKRLTEVKDEYQFLYDYWDTAIYKEESDSTGKKKLYYYKGMKDPQPIEGYFGGELQTMAGNVFTTKEEDGVLKIYLIKLGKVELKLSVPLDSQ